MTLFIQIKHYVTRLFFYTKPIISLVGIFCFFYCCLKRNNLNNIELSSIITIFLLYITYDEQRKSNKINRFENTYWNLREQITPPSNEQYTESIKLIYKKMKQHFMDKTVSLNINQFICLLNYYWRLHNLNLEKTISYSYFCSLKHLTIYIITSRLIKTKEKSIYLSLLYDTLKPEEKFCFLCYLSSYVYTENDMTVLKKQTFTNPILDTYISNLKINPYSKIKIINYSFEEDYGFHYQEYSMETYSETLKRLNLK